jgi:tetratricopeptide (TPR) repeat protein
MARAAARKKNKSRKVKKANHLAKKSGAALKVQSGAKRALGSKRIAKSKGKAHSGAKRKPISRRPAAGFKKPAFPTEDSKAKAEISSRIPVVEKPPRLLSETKSTTAALAVLERGIKLIYQKDLKKARVELGSLLQSYPQESEILARARTYLQICDREEAARKKPVVTNDQLYTLGVMEHNRGNFATAVANFRQLLEKGQKGDHIYYSLAASLARSGSIPEALQNLRQAIALNEDNRIFAKNDSDFEQLHANSEFADLVGLIPEPVTEFPQS